MANTALPYDTVPELPDFDIEFPEGYFDPEVDQDDLDTVDIDPDEIAPDRGEDDFDEDLANDPELDDFPYHELDDSTELHPVHWLH